MNITLRSILFLSLSTVAFAQQPAIPHDGSFAIRFVEHRLNMNAAQCEQVKAVLQQERGALQTTHTNLAAERNEMAAASSNGFDEARTLAIAAKYAEANTAAIVEREKLRAELFAILTPEQKQKVQQMRERFSAALAERLPSLGDNL